MINTMKMNLMMKYNSSVWVKNVYVFFTELTEEFSGPRICVAVQHSCQYRVSAGQNIPITKSLN